MKMVKQSEIPLYTALCNHNNKKPISFHVPGHKYGLLSHEESFFHDILKIDATELNGLDDLHSPEGPILEAETLLAELYQVQKSFFLINGSTVGNLAMMMAVCSEGDTILVQRNCHKSIINALRLVKAQPIFLDPEYDENWKISAGVSKSTVERAIRLFPDVKAIVLTYPNYYGMVYDLQGIIREAHIHNIPVLVDEAHGSHFIIGSPFPKSAVTLGADVVVQSAHKTLPAMTMGSFMHINSRLVDVEKLKESLTIFQSSSPSYPIMASLDLARNYLAEYQQKDVDYLLSEINKFKKELAKIPTIKVLDFPNAIGDWLKITIQTRCSLNGFELQQKLEQYSIYTELADPNNVLLVLPLLKKGQTYPLQETAINIRKALENLPYQEPRQYTFNNRIKISQLAIEYKEMDRLEAEDISLEKALGCVCAETIIPYPPGIPLLLKGEQITADKLDQLKRMIEMGARFQGGSLLKMGLVKVFRTL
jgi:arginine/lysine/ornithine decarboxylase